MYESIAKEFYGIVNMSLEDIFKGVKLMDEPADLLWEKIVEQFGHEFFLPVIDKNYGHLFVKDLKRHQEHVQKAVSDSIKNEQLILEQCKKQIKAVKEEAEEQNLIFRKEKMALI